MRTTLFHLLIALFFFTSNLFAQQTQTVRGRVIDKATQQPLPGATVVIPNTNPLKGTTTDIDGWFKIPGIQIGRVNIDINFMGYQLKPHFKKHRSDFG